MDRGIKACLLMIGNMLVLPLIGGGLAQLLGASDGQIIAAACLALFIGWAAVVAWFDNGKEFRKIVRKQGLPLT